MKHDDGISVTTEAGMASDHEARILAHQSRICPLLYAPRQGKPLECLDLRLSFKSAPEAEEKLVAMGYNVTRSGINSAAYRSRVTGKCGFHHGLRFRHLGSPVLPTYRAPTRTAVQIGTKRYRSIESAARAMGVEKWDITNSIQRGYWVKRVRHKIKGHQGHKWHGQWSLVIDGKPYKGSLKDVVREYHVDGMGIRKTMKQGYFIERVHVPCSGYRESSITAQAA